MIGENSTYYKKIGLRIKLKREEKHLSYAELSHLTGISKSSLQRYETGNTKKIPMEAIEKLEEALSLPNGYLMGWIDEASPVRRESEKKTINVLTGVKKNGEYIFSETPAEYFADREISVSGDFCVIAPDDSMLKARIKKGDAVFVSAGEKADNGEIAVLFVNGKIFIRHAFYTLNYWTFTAADVDEPPYLTKDPEKDGAFYLGKAVAFFSML